MKAKKLTTVYDYARRKNITTQAVYKQIKSGKLKSVVQFGIKLVIEKD